VNQLTQVHLENGYSMVVMVVVVVVGVEITGIKLISDIKYINTHFRNG